MRKKSKSYGKSNHLDHLELRRLLSTVFVSASATGANDGSSWTNAYTDLQTALAAATNGTTIEVGQGTYKPTAGTDRTISFDLASGVTLQGGYAGTGTDNPDARDVTQFPTILSGDIGTAGDNSDNTYHVVYATGVDSTAVLDGFTVTDGKTSTIGSSGVEVTGGGILIENASPTITNCLITANTANIGGGGMAIEDASAPAVTDCTFSNNTAELGAGIYDQGAGTTFTNCTITDNNAIISGGAIYNNLSSPTLIDCTITGNFATNSGGAVANAGSSPTFINCFISGNQSNGTGGAMSNNYVDNSSVITTSNPVVTNCTIAGNYAAQNYGGIENAGTGPTASTVTITNSILWNDSPGEISTANPATVTFSDVDQAGFTGSNNNISIDPQFARNPGAIGSEDFGNLNLKVGSPVIDVGSNAAISGTDTDINGNARIINGTVDLGADEVQSILYVDTAATGAGDGTSWTDAFTTLSEALTHAVAGSNQMIDVAQGTYFPTAGTDRTATFKLVDGVTIEGGFAGSTSGTPNARDVSLYSTILSGDIGTTGIKFDNSYSVVTGDHVDSTAVLDGFTISDGHGKSGGGGGGVYNYYGNETIKNSTITNNYAGRGGGVFDAHSSPTLTNSTITGNSANFGGGITNYESSSPTLINCLITGNDGSVGGGVVNAMNSSPSIINCTISGNTADQAGAIYDYGNSDPTVVNSIIWGDTTNDRNEIDNVVSSQITISYSDVQGATTAPGTGNININPFFTDAGSGDYSIEPYSPAVDAGNNSVVPNGVTSDLAGNSRFQDVPTSSHSGSGTPPLVDMGAYEATASLGGAINGPYEVVIGQSIPLAAFGSSDASGALTYSWDLNNDGTFGDATGANPTFDTTGYTQRTTQTIAVQITDANNQTVTETSTVLVVPPIIYVDVNATGAGDGTSWTDAFTSLASALGVSAAGETIEVGQGTYTPTAGADRTATFELVDGISVEGGFGGVLNISNPDQRDLILFNSTLSGDIGTLSDSSDNSYNVVSAHNLVSGATLDGFTIIGGNADGGGLVGGGILVDDSYLTVSNCLITGNSADDGGGGIYADNSSLTVSNCTISINNSAEAGAGVFVNASTGTITNSIISANTASFRGGGVFEYDGSAVNLTGCTISANNALYGAGVYDEHSSPSLVSCTLTGNTAGNSGGGMYNDYSSPTLTNCVISGNVATNEGGAISNYTSSPTIINCTISGNSAQQGGALYNAGYNASYTSDVTVVNSILWNNTATDSGNEIYNNAFGSVTITYSDVEGGATGTGNINADPQFVRAAGTNGPTDFGDLRLQDASPVVNAGSNSAIPNGITTDIAGNNRIIAATVDMGAYEVVAVQAQMEAHILMVQAGSPFTLKIDLEDANGNIVATDNSNVTLQIGSGTPITVAAQNGVATFTNLQITQVGNYNLNYSVGTLTTSQLNNISVFAGSAASLSISQQPTDTAAGQDIPLTIQVKDQYGNLADGTSVTVALASGTGTLNGTKVLSTVGGIADFTDLNIDQAGQFSFLITDGSLTPVTSNTFQITPGAAATLSISQQPSATTAGQDIPLTVQVKDSFGNLTDGSSVTVVLAAGPSIGTLNGTKTLATTGGVANFTDLTIDQAGGYSFTVTDGSLTALTSNPFVINAAAPAKLAFITQPTDTAVGQAIAGFGVMVEDQFGNPVDDSSTISITSTPAGITGSVAANHGLAEFTTVTPSTAGSFTLTATDGSLIAATSDSFKVTGAPAQLVISQQPANAAAGQTIPTTEVKVEDSFGNLVDGTSVTIALAAGGSTGTLNGTTTVATTGGIADFTDLNIDQAGTFSFAITDGSLPGLTSNTFTITAGPAASISISQQPANAVAGQPISLAVQVNDQFGNPVDGSNVTVAIGTGTSGATLGGTLTEASTGGIAAFNNLTLDRAGAFTLTAADGSLATATSNSFTVSFSGPTLVFTTEPTNAVAGAKTLAFNVTAENTDGTTITTSKAKIKVTLSSGGKILGKTTVPAKSGVATFSKLAIQKAGDYTLTASSAGLEATPSSQFTITSGAASKMIFNPQPGPATHGTPFSVNLQLTDKYGNVATADTSTVTLVLGSHPKTATPLSLSQGVSDGVADFDNVVLDAAGKYTLKAADGKLKATSKKFTVA